MQKVKVKDVNTKKGTNDKGDWEMTVITGEDGSKFGTFHKGATAIQAGDLIELEPIVKGRNINFEVWNMLEKGSTQAPAVTAGGNGYRRDKEGIKYEYDLKAWMQNVDRVSIEGQIALKEIGQWLRTPEAVEGCPDQLKELYISAIRTLIQRMVKAPANETPKEQPKAPVSTGTGQPVDPQAPFPHVGALLDYWNKQGVGRDGILQILGISEKDLPKQDVAEAHKKIQAELDKNSPQQSETEDPEGIDWK